jgi:glycyl-tRNA synthetase beta chain
MKTKEFLLEIGTEEIPAAALNAAVSDLRKLAEEAFTSDRLKFSGVEAYGTPRRLVLYVESMAVSQEDIVEERRGPSKKAAYDADGNLTRAATGFAKGQGVDVSDIVVIQTEKGEYISVKKKISGEKTEAVLSELLPKLIFSLPFKKSMRWSDGSIRFSRPIHWILSLFGGDVVDFSIGDFSSGALKSSNLSRGHRFLSSSKFKVKNFKHYRDELKKRFVIIDAEKRKSMIKSDIAKIEKNTSLKVIDDAELMDHVANLVEYPVTVMGDFDEKFLDLPDDVLKTSMKEHQKYFAMTKGGDRLANSFINVMNTKPKDERVVVKGNERVLRARLSDAEFFYNEDKKNTLDSCNERLRGVIFQKKLGTMYEKVERIVKNTGYLADVLAPDIKETAMRAALLCKADLVTEMVGEFPKLQGVMGREYAGLAGEAPEVSDTLYEHYLPTSADGTLPETGTGAVVSIADKIDTIVSCFSVGLIPTGSADPFALRRQTLGILNIVLDKKYTISLNKIIKSAYGNIKEKAGKGEDETVGAVMEFFLTRLKNKLTSEGFSYDVVDAVLTLGLNNVNDSLEKIKALSRFKERPDFEALSISFKRVANIVKGVEDLNVDPSLFDHDSERALYDKFNDIKNNVDEHVGNDDYLKALEVTTELKGPIDKFFDDVLVMVEDETIKRNRLGLLLSIQKIFLNIADFKKID